MLLIIIYILILIVANKQIPAKNITTKLPDTVMKNPFPNFSLKLSFIVTLYALNVLYKITPNKITYNKIKPSMINPYKNSNCY